MLKTIISPMVHAHRAFGKSLTQNQYDSSGGQGIGNCTYRGLRISAMKLGSVIWPMKV